jgi:hypothetical protein
VALVRLSDQAHKTIAAERETVANRVRDLERQAKALQLLLETVQTELRSSTRMLQQMDEMLGTTAEMPIDMLSEELRGRRLREVAVNVLRQRKGAGAEIHYRDWLDLLTSSGARVGGKNPAATLLTQIANAPEIESVRPRSGLYRLTSD